MERLWTPWRFSYIAEKHSAELSVEENACVFCAIRDALQNGIDDAETMVLFRGRHTLIVLNIYPYISGHMLIVPYSHVNSLDTLEKVASDEMMDLAKTCQSALRSVYSPHGYNIGMNLGSAAGAGIAEHIHLHVMPRWIGDANFITTIGETRTIPEDLATTYQRLKTYFGTHTRRTCDD